MRTASTGAFAGIAGQGKRAKRHAVEAVGKGDHVAAAGDLAGQLDRGLDGVGAGRAGHHHLVIHAARLQDLLFIGGQEGGLGVGVHVQRMGDAVARDMVDQRGLHVRVVVPVVERGTARQKVDIAVALGVVQGAALSGGERGGEGPAVGPGFAFTAVIDRLGHVMRPFGTKGMGGAAGCGAPGNRFEDVGNRSGRIRRPWPAADRRCPLPRAA